MPGTFGSGAGVGGDGARLMILLQLGLKMPVYRKWKRINIIYLGQAILWLLLLQMRRQLQGHRTYLRPGGAFLMGVASLQELHFTTCCSSGCIRIGT